MPNYSTSHLFSPFLSILIGLLFAVAFSLLAFSEPAQAPPGGNVAAPVNVSDTAQSKAGDLTVRDVYARNLFSGAGGANEGNLSNLNSLVGYNDIFIKGNSSETAPVYIAGSDIHFYTNGTEKLTVINNGNVGIGTASPGQKLDVAGQIHATGDICTDVGGKCLGTTEGNKFGGLYSYSEIGGCACGCPNPSCNNSNPYTGGCSCPPWAPSSASVTSFSQFGGDMWCNWTSTKTTYQCYK